MTLLIIGSFVTCLAPLESEPHEGRALLVLLTRTVPGPPSAGDQSWSAEGMNEIVPAQFCIGQ